MVQGEWPQCDLVLQLNMPNIVLMDLVVFFLFPYLIRLTYNSHTVPMLLFSSHTHASCTPHFIHLCAVHGYVLLFFSSILPPPYGCSMSFFHFMAMLDACP